MLKTVISSVWLAVPEENCIDACESPLRASGYQWSCSFLPFESCILIVEGLAKSVICYLELILFLMQLKGYSRPYCQRERRSRSDCGVQILEVYAVLP